MHFLRIARAIRKRIAFQRMRLAIKNQCQHDRDADQRLFGNGAREFHHVFRYA
jgi:hypothetical protein